MSTSRLNLVRSTVKRWRYACRFSVLEVLEPSSSLWLSWKRSSSDSSFPWVLISTGWPGTYSLGDIHKCLNRRPSIRAHIPIPIMSWWWRTSSPIYFHRRRSSARKDTYAGVSTSRGEPRFASSSAILVGSWITSRSYHRLVLITPPNMISSISWSSRCLDSGKRNY